MKERGTRDLVEKYNENLAAEKIAAEQGLKREQTAHSEVCVAFCLLLSPFQSWPSNRVNLVILCHAVCDKP